MRFIKSNFLILLSLFFLSSCLGTKYLKEDQKLLFKQKIKIDRAIDKEEVEQLYAQNPNRQFPFIPFAPYVWFYYWGLKSYDISTYENKKVNIEQKYDQKIASTQKEEKKQKLVRKKRKKLTKLDDIIENGNTLMQWGEPLAIYDSSRTALSKERMNLYLDSKGYFNSNITHENSVKRKRITSTFTIDPGSPYKIDTLFSAVGDSVVSQLISENKNKSFLKKGKNYEQNNITKERERIDLLLTDNGYFDFSRQYIEFQVDTAFKKSAHVAVKTIVNNPASRDYHKVFHVDSVNFITDSNVKNIPDSLRLTEVYNGVTYRYFQPAYSKKVLSRRVFIKKDSLYSKSKTFNTQRQLANLDHFRLVNINYDSTGGKLVANIFTSPLKRYQWTNEVGVNVTQGFPGPFYNISFKKRNIFKGLEIFEMNGRIGIEGVTAANDPEQVYASVEAGVNATLTFPQFILPISNTFKQSLGQVNPKTRLLAGYSYTDRPEYERRNTNFSNTYSWQNKRNTSYQVTLTDISVIESVLRDSLFQVRLEELERSGNRLIDTFEPSFVSSMSGSATWNFNSYGLNFSNSSFLRLFLESGGTTLNFVNTSFLEREALEFFQYYKASVDFRKINPINKNTTIAYRINAGYARAYGDNGILPYEKYFFAGGSNGIRAWRPRRLGPGSYVQIDSLNNEVNYDTEQTGEILFEGSIELRKNLFGFIDYAFFLDFGNTWTIREDARVGAKFEKDKFFREIALGGGFGLRFDFSFLILRLDAGIKLYDPARPEGRRFILSDGFYEAPFTRSATEPIIFNIGIGYPF